MAIEVFNRYENKYVLDDAAFHRFYGELLDYAEPDAYNKQHPFYTIANLYYDTDSNTIIRHSLSKPKYKEKLRLRAYGTPNLESKVYMEIKKKVLGLVNKRRTALTLHEAYDFAATGTAPEIKDDMNRQVIREISYLMGQYELKPAVYLSYDRKALFARGNRDLRITFDTNIQCRRYDLRLEDGPYGEQLLQPGQWLMEVKAEKTIPLWLSQLLSRHRLYRTSFSKYGNEYKAMIAKKRAEGSCATYA